MGLNDGDRDGRMDGIADIFIVGKCDGVELGIVEVSLEGYAELDPSVGLNVGSEEGIDEVGPDFELGFTEGF